jgi:hypothetical protein
MPSRLALLVGAAGAVALAATDDPCSALVCRCVPARALGLSDTALVRRQRERAVAVFRGTVVRLDTLPGPPLDAGAAAPGPTGAVRAVVHVDRVWKGAVGDTAVVVLHPGGARRSSCDAALAPGTAYVVFAAPAYGGALATRQCTGTVPADRAGVALAALGAGDAPGQQPRP